MKQLERRRVDQHLPARRLRFVRVDERRPDDEALLAPEVRDRKRADLHVGLELPALERLERRRVDEEQRA